MRLVAASLMNIRTDFLLGSPLHLVGRQLGTNCGLKYVIHSRGYQVGLQIITLTLRNGIMQV